MWKNMIGSLKCYKGMLMDGKYPLGLVRMMDSLQVDTLVCIDRMIEDHYKLSSWDHYSHILQLYMFYLPNQVDTQPNKPNTVHYSNTPYTQSTHKYYLYMSHWQ